MKALIAVLRPEAGERSRLVLSVLLAAGATGCAIALLASSGYVISRAAQRPMIISLTVAIVAVRAFGICRAALRYSERLASHDLALRALARLRVRFFRRLAPLVPGQLQDRGELLARFVSDVDSLQDAYLRVMIPALVAVLVIAGAGTAAALMLGPAAVVLVGTLALIAVVNSWLSAVLATRSARGQAPARALLTSQLVEAIDGAAELALSGRSEEQVHRLASTDRGLQRLARRDALASGLATGLHAGLTGLGLLAVLIVGIEAVRSGAMPGVLLAAVAFLYLGAGEAVQPLPAAARRLRSCAKAASRLQEVCDQAPAIVDPVDPMTPAGGGSLELHGVTLRYGPGQRAVLSDVDFRLVAGERVALVGPSGTGKSTLSELLVRFLDPVSGQVTLDGIDVRRLRQEDLRGAVLLCSQDAHLFNTTIRENLLIGRRSASEAELWDALAVAELDGFVAGLTHGLDTPVGQEGELFSGGQRRRLALARALVADCRFLVLDEPLAHLDAALARRVLRRLLAAAGNRGLLVITHATDMLDGFDRVISLRGGRLSVITRSYYTPDH